MWALVVFPSWVVADRFFQQIYRLSVWKKEDMLIEIDLSLFS
jgi:hypothetical protein